LCPTRTKRLCDVVEKNRFHAESAREFGEGGAAAAIFGMQSLKWMERLTDNGA
jgi:hypothetical protein